jgi:2,4-dienoyl-CoA reductase-like NADH-dependent reductase (Old Yellow Enzyme family)
VPQLFDPIKIRDLTIRNRVWVSPMCQYSATGGVPNNWHLVHYGQFAVGQVGLVMTEAVAIAANARSTLLDTGIWNAEQIDAWAEIVEFVKSQGSAIGIQLWHTGRKGSTTTPWQGQDYVPTESGGWTTVAPSELPFGKLPVPNELTHKELVLILDDFRNAASNALLADFDVLEIHAAHGYLIHSFLSPIANKRDDQYGGSFSGRTRFILQVVDAVREVWPKNRPLFVRSSASDWRPDGWSVEDTVALSHLLYEHGVDLIDCSSGGILPELEYDVKPGYQVPFAEQVKKNTKILAAAVGLITKPEQAAQIIESGQADAVMLGREMLRDPHWALRAATALKVDLEWPDQYKQAKPRKDWSY